MTTRAPWSIQEIRVDGFFKHIPRMNKRYVTVRIDQGELWTYRNIAITKGVLEWKRADDCKHFEAFPTSTLELKLFEEPLTGVDGKEVGHLAQSLKSFLDPSLRRPCSLQFNNKRTSFKATVVIIPDEPHIPHSPGGDQDELTDCAPSPPNLPNYLINAHKALKSAGIRGIGSPGMPPVVGQVVNGVHSASEGIDETKDALAPLVERLNGFMKLMDDIAELHPYAKLAWSAVSAAYKIYENQKHRDEKVNELANNMQDAYDTVLAGDSLKDVAKRSKTGKVQIEEVRAAIERHENVLKDLSMQTVECGNFIVTYAKDRHFGTRAAKQIFINPDNIVRRFGERFKELQVAYEQQANISTEIVSVRVLQTVEKLEMADDLSGLREVYIMGAGCNSEKECLPGTRTAVLDDISEWINRTEDNTPKVRLLLGEAGTGKSTIAHTLGCRFRKMKRLGGAFCFKSSAPQQSRHALATLAVDLADFDLAFKKALWNVVGQQFAAQTTDDLAHQFENFILKPSQDLSAVSSVLIILEGLDEIGGVGTRAPLLRILSNRLCELPPGFRVLLTARPERDIINIFKRSKSCTIQDLSDGCIAEFGSDSKDEAG